MVNPHHIEAVAVTAALISMWIIGDKNRGGWLIKAIGQFLSVPMNILIGYYGFAILGAVGFFISVRNYYKWGKQP